MSAAVGDPRAPTFLILGAPKCGTTALAVAAAKHPEVLLSRPKEPHFFDCHFEKGLAVYQRDHFRSWQSGYAAGEATPSYLALPWVPRRIAETVPHARLVAVLRHPVERAYSSWWMFHARGMDRLSFDDAIADNVRRLEREPLADDDASRQSWQEHVGALERGDALRIRTYLDSGHYAKQLRHYFELLPRERALVFLSEELLDDGAAVLRRLWRHLGVSEDVPVESIEAANEAVGAHATGILRLAQSAGLMRLRRMLPERARAAVKRRLSAPAHRPSMSLATRAQLIEHFLPHVQELERLLGVNLSAWKR